MIFVEPMTIAGRDVKPLGSFHIQKALLPARVNLLEIGDGDFDASVSVHVSESHERAPRPSAAVRGAGALIVVSEKKRPTGRVNRSARRLMRPNGWASQ